MNNHPSTMKNWNRRVFFVLIVSLIIPLQAFSGGGKKDDPAQKELDFKIQNMALRSVNEAVQGMTEISANYSAPYYSAQYAADGKPVTSWSNFMYYRSSDYLEADFGEEILVSKVMVQNSVDMNSGMTAFDLQYLKGSSWVTIGRYNTSLLHLEQIGIDLPEIKTTAVRITNFSIDSSKNCVAIAEFEVNTPVMTSSIDVSDAPASYANDGKYDTAWSNCFFPLANDFLEVNFGRVVIVRNVQIVNVVDETIGLSTFDLEYHNGISWQKIGQYTTDLIDGEVIEISVPEIYAKQLRIKNFALGSGKTCVGIAEFQVNTPLMDSNASKMASHPPFDASDESTGSYWLNCGEFDEDGALEIDLGTSFEVSRIAITNYYPEEGDAGMMEFTLQYSTNGSSWVTLETVKGALRHHPFFNVKLTSPVNAQYFRLIDFVTGEGRTCVGLSDVSLFTPNRTYVTMPIIVVETLPELTSISLAPDETGADNTEDREIVLTGLNFIDEPGANTIYFENAENPSFSIKNTGGTTTELLATIPKNTPAGLYNVYVVNEYGTSNTLEEGWEISNASVEPESNTDSSSDIFGICFISSTGFPSAFGLEGVVLLVGAFVSILLFVSKKKRSLPQ